mmetsp:Transcript_36462/g.85688  ORF Transcript_36462/g.85688 Transcript_36462/m.85688 type:complete len:94 (+) Transcript_36462:110-391(+)
MTWLCCFSSADWMLKRTVCPACSSVGALIDRMQDFSRVGAAASVEQARRCMSTDVAQRAKFEDLRENRRSVCLPASATSLSLDIVRQETKSSS